MCFSQVSASREGRRLSSRCSTACPPRTRTRARGRRRLLLGGRRHRSADTLRRCTSSRGAPLHWRIVTAAGVVTHARNLLTRLQWEIIARRPSQAMQLQALLMKDFSHLRTPLAQAGFELLRTSLQSSEQITRLGRYGRRMASLDKRHGKWWLISTSVEEVRLNINRQGVNAEGEPALTASSFSGFSRAIESLSGSIRECDAQSGDCDHDGDVHGSIGLYAHAQLCRVAARFEHLADRNKGASSRVILWEVNAMLMKMRKGARLARRLPFEISPSCGHNSASSGTPRRYCPAASTASPGHAACTAVACGLEHKCAGVPLTAGVARAY